MLNERSGIMKKLKALIPILVIVSGIILNASARPVGVGVGSSDEGFGANDEKCRFDKMRGAGEKRNSDDKYYWFTAAGIYISYGTVPEEERRMDGQINSSVRVVREDGYKTVKGVAPNLEPVGAPEVALYSKKNSPNDK
jgi:hypothetical protein